MRFWIPAGKLLGYIVSRKGIKLDPSKIKAIQELPLPKMRKEVMSFLGRLNYISRFVGQSIVVCELIFKLMKKEAPTNGLKSVRVLLMLSRTIFPIHRYWLLHRRESFVVVVVYLR